MRNITTELVLGPITALEVQGNYVLSGETSYLHVYNISSGEHLYQIGILGPHVIHGIRKGRDRLLAVFGQKAVCILHMDLGDNVRFTILCETTELSDWLLDVAFLRYGASPSATCLGLVLAHNSVILWDWKLKACIEHIHCAENCILYSAKLLGDTWESVTVAAGTVFNQIVLWMPRGGRDAMGRVEVSRRLSGHQGVIFNMSYHSRRKLLCSVSDDRSIRLWQLDLEDTPGEQSDVAQTVMYGHSARVWDAKILDDAIVSVGEDGLCCVWNDAGEIVHGFTGHKGGSIWSLAIHENQKLIVTGGGDSSLRIWTIATKQEHCITTVELHLERDACHVVISEDDSVAPSLPCHATDDTKSDAEGFIPRQLAVLTSGKIIIMTLNGCLVCYTLPSKEWRLLSQHPNYQSYSLLSVCPTHQRAALGNIHGSVKIIALDTSQTLVEMSVFTGKVFSLCWVNDDNLFVSGPDGRVIWWKLSRSSDSYRLDEQATFILPEAPQRWVTTVALVPHEEGALVCGDRRGSILLYTQLHHEKQNGKPASPTHTLPGIHGKAGVTHVCHHAGYVYSAGRDGTYRQYRLRGTRLQMMNTFKVYKDFKWIESISFTSTDDVLVSGFHSSSFVIWSTQSNEKLVEIQCGGGHRAWGFATCQGPAALRENSSDPGGSSPTQGANVTEGDGNGSTLAVFACIKAKKVIVCTAPAEKLQHHPILKDSLHGKQVSCIKYLATVTIPGGDCAVYASGSEDNTVNISAFISSQSQPPMNHVLHRLNVHISSVRCLATCPSSYSNNSMDSAEVTEGQERGQTLLLFSVGGRRAIQCWRVTLPFECTVKYNVHKLLKSSCTVEHLASHGNVDNVKQRRWLIKQGRTADAETRFMSVCVWKANDLSSSKTDGGRAGTECLLGVSGSDAVIRIFVFNEQTNELFPVLSTDWHHCCLLTTLSVVHPCPWGPIPILLTAGTEGKVALWDVKKAIGECGVEDRECTAITNGEVDTDELNREEECVLATLGMNPNNCNSSSETSSNHGEMMVSSETHTNNRQPPTSQDQDSELKATLTSQSQPNSEETEASLSLSSPTREKGHLGYLTPDDPSDRQKDSTALWDVEEDIGRLLLSVQAHQSGVNALCISQIDKNRYLLGSGGDDNSVHLALLTVSCNVEDEQLSFKLECHHSIRCAHAAQVTGLCFVDPCTLVSSSIDQRLNIWKVELASNETPVMKVDQIRSMFTLVADSAGMAHWTPRDDDHYITVCGQGVQVLRLKDH